VSEVDDKGEDVVESQELAVNDVLDSSPSHLLNTAELIANGGQHPRTQLSPPAHHARKTRIRGNSRLPQSQYNFSCYNATANKYFPDWGSLATPRRRCAVSFQPSGVQHKVPSEGLAGKIGRCVPPGQVMFVLKCHAFMLYIK